jgi:glucuronoarabinoxylan endo-1,4-beta-xylanase
LKPLSPSGEKHAWNTKLTKSGAAVTARNVSYNAAIATNGGVSFGSNGSQTGSNPAPAGFTLNGVACTGGTVPSTPPSTPPQRRLDQRHQPRRAHPDQR